MAFSGSCEIPSDQIPNGILFRRNVGTAQLSDSKLSNQRKTSYLACGSSDSGKTLFEITSGILFVQSDM